MLTYYLTADTILPSEINGESVRWQSSLAGMLDEQRKLLPPSTGISDEFQLIAEVKDTKKTFCVRVLGLDSQQLAGYTRKPDRNPDVYSNFVAYSLHLALQAGGQNFEALNSNYGILFAKADYSYTVVGETILFGMPRLFRLAKQGFGILAIPLNEHGKIQRSGEVLFFTTTDFVHYEERGRIKLSENTLMDYSCELDAETLLYRIGWKEKDGKTRFVTTDDFIQFSSPKLGEMFPVNFHQLTVESAENAQLITLTASEAEYVRNKLGRVRHVSIDPLSVSIPVGSTSLHVDTIRATARYSDSSISLKRIAVDPVEVAALDFSRPAVYKLKAKILRYRFPYPMMRTRPDPYVLLYKGRYYFISTDDDRQRKIYIRSADTLEGLEDGRTEEILLWDGNIPNGERIGQHWAPELHVIDDKLYCFLAISVNNEWHGVQAHVALLKGEDPMNPDHWDAPRRVLDRHGNVLTDLYEKPCNITLDMTYFEHCGKSYVSWSQPKWRGEEQERANVYIATIDPKEPWRLTCDPVRICRNEYGWDRNDLNYGVSEGPFVMKRNDKIFMVYSGAGVSPKYTVGLLEMSVEDDPMNPTAWKKFNYPLMHSLSLPSQYGPGHNMLLQDHYGEWYNVYHAYDVNRGLRDASIRPVHFRFDGTPIFDMRDEEELLPEYEYVTLTVVVE